ncbi:MULTISPECIES: tetratricopeptide repeat protein [Inquilinus]|uniref:Sel1 repeat family protein n=1 Tax=Inquilinus ginsengisoli TaxID=363840 RepID=A0ABU1JLE5_9PROT|nr:hypothetical protein [Inquilinus ginsengisoli]MDR6289446.1 hypothetical protein [Inquilinus ginsengisoli]
MRIDSMKRLQRDAEQGDAAAQFNLGVLYGNREDDNGYALEDRRAEAIKWLTRAASQGLHRAQGRLAEIYGEDPEVSKDAVKACMWFVIAAKGLSGAQQQSAQAGYERAAAHLTVLEIARAQRRAATWKPKVETVAAPAAPLPGLGRIAS